METQLSSDLARHRVGLGKCELRFAGRSEVVVKKHENVQTTTTVLDETTEETKALTAEEERILRMRTGAALEPGEKLGSKLDGVKAEHRQDVAARLALMEAEILAALNANPELRTDKKKKIVDALRETE